MRNKTQTLCILALLCALSAVGARFPIYGSVALDALPAFLAALLLGGMEGAAVGAAGHLLTATLSGFPLTLPLHLVIAAEMAGVCFITGRLRQRGKLPIPACTAAAFLLNALASPLVLLFWPGMGLPVFLAFLPPLLAGSAANALGAGLLAGLLERPLKTVWERGA